MKLYTLLLLFASQLLCVTGDEPIDYLGVKGPLTFNTSSFKLAWSAKTDVRYAQEYIPKGETLEHFNEMLTLILYVTNTSVDEALQQRLNSLGNNPSITLSNSNVTESPDGTEKILDCLLTAKNSETAEFTILHFKQLKLGDKKGIVVYSYSKRFYGNDIIIFTSNFRDERTDLLNAMISSEIPTVKITN